MMGTEMSGGIEGIEHTFQRRLGSRTARCSLCRRWGMEEVKASSEDDEGSEWHERVSKDEEEEAAAEVEASVAFMVKTRRSASTGDIPSDTMLEASS